MVKVLCTPSDTSIFNRNFVVPKNAEGVNSIINLKALNGFLKTKHFKMELEESIGAALLYGMWTVST